SSALIERNMANRSCSGSSPWATGVSTIAISVVTSALPTKASVCIRRTFSLIIFVDLSELDVGEDVRRYFGDSFVLQNEPLEHLLLSRELFAHVPENGHQIDVRIAGAHDV